MNNLQGIYEEISNSIKGGKSFKVATVVRVTGSAPQISGAKMIIYNDGKIFGTIGGGRVEFAVMEKAKQINEPTLLSYNLARDLSMCCGGEMEIFVEPFSLSKKVIVFGAGHIAFELVPLLKKNGFYITVADDRTEYANKDRFPEADEIIGDFHLDFLKKITFTKNHYIIIATREHRYDLEVLDYAIDKEYRYLGMVASKSKLENFKRRLIDRGLDEELLARVHSPIGLNIGGNSPFEIAVSIIAEIIKEGYQCTSAPVHQ